MAILMHPRDSHAPPGRPTSDRPPVVAADFAESRSRWGRRAHAGIRLGALLAVLLLLTGGRSATIDIETADPERYLLELKASYLLKFAEATQWPTNTLGPAHDSFRIGLLGPESAVRVMQSFLANKRLHGKPVEVLPLDSASTNAAVHLLYVGPDINWARHPLHERLPDQGVLLVADTAAALKQGAAVGFRKRESLTRVRIEFEVEVGEAEKAGLRLGSRMLEYAAAVWRDGRPIRPGGPR